MMHFRLYHFFTGENIVYHFFTEENISVESRIMRSLIMNYQMK